MPGPLRWLTAVALALLLAGAGGVIAHDRNHTPPGPSALGRAPTRTRSTIPAPTTISPATTSPQTTSPPVVVPTIPAGSAESSADLAAGMVTPTDMGGYYRIDPSAASSILDSAPCLASLQPSASQGGRAETALLGPDLHSVPTIVEVAASYLGQEPASVYRAVVSAVRACPSFRLTFGGTTLSVPLRPTTVPPVGLADMTWSGPVAYAGTTLAVQLGVVVQGHTVVAMMWVDTDPPSAAIMGDFTSTLSLVIGKLA